MNILNKSLLVLLLCSGPVAAKLTLDSANDVSNSNWPESNAHKQQDAIWSQHNQLASGNEYDWCGGEGKKNYGSFSFDKNTKDVLRFTSAESLNDNYGGTRFTVNTVVSHSGGSDLKGGCFLRMTNSVGQVLSEDRSSNRVRCSVQYNFTTTSTSSMDQAKKGSYKLSGGVGGYCR